MTTNKKILLLILSIAIISLTTIASYAFFTVNVAGNNTAYNTVIQTGEMALSLVDSEQVDVQNSLPGTSSTKTFKVKNTGTIQTNYDVYVSEIFSDFVDRSDLVYTLTSPTGCQNTTQTQIIPDNATYNKIVSSCAIAPNQEHEYTLTVLFKEDNTNQDDNKGKFFSGKISVNEYKKIAKLTDGPTVNERLKTLAGTTANEIGSGYMESLNEVLEPYTQQFGITSNVKIINLTTNENVTTIMFSNDLPQDLTNAVKISASESDIDIYATFDTDTITIHSLSDKIYSNEDGTATFAAFANLDNINGNVDLSVFDTTYLSNGQFMFAQNGYKRFGFNRFNTPNLKDMMGMFFGSTKMEYMVVDTDTSKVENMLFAFGMMPNLTELNIDTLNTSNVRYMGGMFNQDSALTELNVSSFDTSKTVDMYAMFYEMTSLTSLDISNFNTKNVVYMSSLFSNTTNLSTLNLGNNFDTSNVVNADWMFALCGLTTIDLGPKFSTASLISAEGMFSKMPNLTTIKTPNIEFGNSINRDGMFWESPNLVGGAGTTYSSSYPNGERAKIDGGVTNPGYFTLRS